MSPFMPRLLRASRIQLCRIERIAEHKLAPVAKQVAAGVAHRCKLEATWVSLYPLPSGHVCSGRPLRPMPQPPHGAKSIASLTSTRIPSIHCTLLIQACCGIAR